MAVNITPTKNHENPANSNFSQTVIHIEPREVFFANVVPGQVYSKCVQLKNTSTFPVECEIKPGNPVYYQVSPANVVIPSKGNITVTIRLKLLRPMSTFNNKNPKPNVEHTSKKDIFYVRSEFFKDKFYSFIVGNPEMQNNCALKGIASTDTNITTATTSTKRTKSNTGSNSSDILDVNHPITRTNAAIRSAYQLLAENDSLFKHPKKSAKNQKKIVNTPNCSIDTTDINENSASMHSYQALLKSKIEVLIMELTQVKNELNVQRTNNIELSQTVRSQLLSKDQIIAELKQDLKHYSSIVKFLT